MALHFKQLLTLVDVDKKLAIVLAGLGLILLILAATAFRSLVLLQVSVTLLLASAVYLLLRRRRRASPTEEDVTEARSVVELQPRFSQLLDIAFWGLFITSLIIISQGAYARPLSFLILVSIMASILAVEIFANKNTAYCLIKVLIIGILLRASAYYQFPSPLGLDSVIEVDTLRQLVATGHLGDFMGSYIYYPIAYILTAFTSFTTGLGPKDSFFTLAVVEVISLVFLFLVARQLFDKKIALLAALIVAVLDWHVFKGFALKAQTLGIAWVPILIFFLLASRQKGKLLPFSILGILIMFLVIVTHTFATAAVVTILIIAWLSFLICKYLPGKDKFQQPVTLTIVLLSLTATLGYWMYASGFIGYIGLAINYALSFDTGGVKMFTLTTSATVLTWQKLPVLMLIFFAILGCLSIFNFRKLDRKALSQVWFALICGAMIILGLIIFYIPQLGALESMRWHVFMCLIIAVPAACGLLSILGRKGWRNLIMLFLLVFSLSGIMTTSHIATVDSVIPWEHQIRGAFTSSEMAAAETVSQMVGLAPGQTPQGDTEIYADFLYTLLLEYEFHIPYDKVVDASPIFKEELEEYHGILMLRTAVTTEVVSATFEGGHEEFVMDQSQYQSFVDDPQSLLIYDNGMVKALQRP